MKKLLLLLTLLLSANAEITINATLCDKIATDPHSTLPKECKNYVEADAQKAFDNTKEKKGLEITEDMLKFKKEQDKK